MSILSLFIFNFKTTLSRHMQYRFDFLVGIFISLGMAFGEPILQLIFYNGVNGFDGWNVKQILIFQGVLMVWIGIKDTMFGGVRGSMQTMVRDGSLDRLLNKPYSPIILIFSGGFSFLGIGPLLSGIAVLSYSISINGINISLMDLSIVTFFMLLGILLYVDILIVYCSVVIHLVSMSRLDEIMDKFLKFSEYPINIYPAAAQFMLTAFLPLALWVYYPSQAILHRLYGLSFINILGSILVSIVALFISIQIFKISLIRYSSTGG